MRSRDIYSSPFLQAADGVNFAACPEDTSEGFAKKIFNCNYNRV